MTALNITEAMLSLMAEEPRKVVDMADALDCSVPQIISRLRRLEAGRKVQRQRVNNRSGFHYVWHIYVAGRILPTIHASPMPEQEDEEDNPTVGALVQRIVTTWKPNHVRNEFETYFHGPARREAA